MCWARIINFMHHRSWHKIISAAMNKKEGHLRFLNLPDGLILSKAVACNQPHTMLAAGISGQAGSL